MATLPLKETANVMRKTQLLCAGCHLQIHLATTSAPRTHCCACALIQHCCPFHRDLHVGICRGNQPLKRPPSIYAYTVLSSVILGEEHNQHCMCEGWECNRNLEVFTFLLVCAYNISISVSEDSPV